MIELEIDMLGTFEARVNGMPITEFHSNKVRALLAYLAVESDRSHERELLAELLWPDERADKSLTNLRQTLHRLGQALEQRPALAGALSESETATPLLQSTRQALRINSTVALTLDTRAFVDLLDTVAAHRHRRLIACPECIGRLRQAIRLYRGNFLAGFSIGGALPFEEWQLLWRERLRERCVWALAALAKHHEQRGEYATAAEYLRRLLELEPWHEEAHRRLIAAFAYDGQRGLALAQYERCRRALAKEIGATPTPDTESLIARVRTGRLSAPPVPLFAVPAMATPIIGHQGELETIAARLAGLDCRMLTLIGPGGIGKTRLAVEAAAAARGAFADGIIFVDLSTVSAAERLADTLVEQLGLPAAQPSPAATHALCAYLCTRELLIVLDNFEHLLDGTGLLAELLAAAPDLRLLVTSREPLHLAAEWVVRVEGLELPAEEPRIQQRAHGDNRQSTTCNQAEDYPALQLFIQTTRQADAAFAPDADTWHDIVRICRAVAGSPLAIIMAADLSQHRPIAAILLAIEYNLDTLATTRRDSLERHCSIRALFASAWQLLSPLERRVLSHCSVFKASFSCKAAAAVIGRFTEAIVDVGERAVGQRSNRDAIGTAQSRRGPEVARALESLVEKSLVQHGVDGRYTLQNLVRRCAAEQLAHII